MLGRIILEIAVIFVVFNLGYVMGFKACSRYIQKVIEKTKIRTIDRLLKENMI